MHNVALSWGQFVVKMSMGGWITDSLYTHAQGIKATLGHKYGSLYPNIQVFVLDFYYFVLGYFRSVDETVIPTIHKTYNKPQLFKVSNFVISRGLV